MSAVPSEIKRRVMTEVESLPEEYSPFLLDMIRSYRESVMLQPAAEGFRRGWKEALRGETLPVDQLWEGLDVD